MAKKAVSKEVKNEIRKEISSRLCLLLLSSIFLKIMYHAWPPIVRSLNEDAAFIEALGGAIVIIVLVILTILGVVVFIFQFTKDGMHTK